MSIENPLKPYNEIFIRVQYIENNVPSRNFILGLYRKFKNTGNI